MRKTMPHSVFPEGLVFTGTPGDSDRYLGQLKIVIWLRTVGAGSFHTNEGDMHWLFCVEGNAFHSRKKWVKYGL